MPSDVIGESYASDAKCWQVMLIDASVASDVIDASYTSDAS